MTPTPSPLSPAELAELARLEAAATPGPWILDEDYCDCGGEYGCSHGAFPTYLLAPAKQIERYGKIQPGKMYPAEIANFTEAHESNWDDANLLLELRNAAPRLLVSLAACEQRSERLAGRVTELEKLLQHIAFDLGKDVNSGEAAEIYENCGQGDDFNLALYGVVLTLTSWATRIDAALSRPAAPAPETETTK